MRRRPAREQEFREYVAQRRVQLRRTAYLLCGDVHKAEDLVQTALIKLYAAWPRVRSAGNVDAYVRRVLVNSSIDESRRPWRREEPGLDGLDRPGGEPTATEDRSAIMDALGSPGSSRRAAAPRRGRRGSPSSRCSIS